MPTINVKIDDVAFGGDGVARHEGKVIFVPGTLPGEIVDVEITSSSKRFCRAHPVRIVEASLSRIENDCPYSLHPENGCSDSKYCPGCAYRHASYETEVELKKKQLSDLLTRIAKLDTLPALEAEPSPINERYRNKITLHPASSGGWGYYSADNKSVIPISDCKLACPSIGEAIQAAPEPADAESDLVFRHTEIDGMKFWQTPLPSGPHLTESTYAGEMIVPPASFAQVNPRVSSALTEYTVRCISEAKPENVVDLYSGTGLFAIAAAKAGIPNVFGVEIDQRSVDCATKNARRLCPGHANFICAAAAPGLKTILGALRSLRGSAVIVDPPRKGLEPQLMTLLKRDTPDMLLYISCAADKLARDTKELIAGGYTIESLKIFDMFPRTASFETVAVFRKTP